MRMNLGEARFAGETVRLKLKFIHLDHSKNKQIKEPDNPTC